MTTSESETRQPRLFELMTSLFRGRETKQRDLMLGAAWQVALAALGFVLAALTIYWYVRPLKGDEQSAAFATVLMYAAAAQATGAALGFLFGVPRSRPIPDASGATTANTRGEPSISQVPNAPNTNLEQVSDWLTKILVGVGLTQAKSIANGFANVVGSMAAGLPKTTNPEPFLGSLLIFSAVMGFLAGWVMARVWLARLLEASDRNMPEQEPHGRSATKTAPH